MGPLAAVRCCQHLSAYKVFFIGAKYFEPWKLEKNIEELGSPLFILERAGELHINVLRERKVQNGPNTMPKQGKKTDKEKN